MDGPIYVENPMKTLSVLLLEHPDGAVHHTRLPWTNLTVHTHARTGATVALKTRPDVVLLSLRQSERNGLQIARVLRKRLGAAPIIIVYGQPTGSQRRQLRAQRQQLRSKWGVDRFLATDPSGSRLAELVHKIAEERQRRAGALAVAPSPAPAEALVAHKRPGMTVIIRQRMHQAVREATARSAARRPEKPRSSVARFFHNVVSFFRRSPRTSASR